MALGSAASARAPFISVQDLYLLLVVLLARLTSGRSKGVRKLIVVAIGCIAYALSSDKRRATEAGLRHAFGDRMSASRIGWTTLACFAENWKQVFEMFAMGAAPDRAIEPWTVDGEEHLRQALERGRGVILWESSLFGHRMASRQILRRAGYRVTVLHAEAHLEGFVPPQEPRSLLHNRVVRPIFESIESPFVDGLLYIPHSRSMGYLRICLDLLGANRMLCVSADGAYGFRSVEVPFLSTRHRVMTGMQSLARLSGAALMPMFCFQDDRNRVRMVIHPPLLTTAERDDAGTARTFTALQESYARRFPAQYRGWAFLASQRRRVIPTTPLQPEALAGPR